MVGGVGHCINYKRICRKYHNWIAMWIFKNLLILIKFLSSNWYYIYTGWIWILLVSQLPYRKCDKCTVLHNIQSFSIVRQITQSDGTHQIVIYHRHFNLRVPSDWVDIVSTIKGFLESITIEFQCGYLNIYWFWLHFYHLIDTTFIPDGFEYFLYHN